MSAPMPVRELSRSPSMVSLFARAGLSMIPGASLLPFVSGRGGEVPDVTVVLNEVSVDRDRLASYDGVCAFAVRDTLPVTYPHMLAFPLHLALLTDSQFPFGPVGLVHIDNRIVQHRPLQASEVFSLRVWAGPMHPHSHGRQFSIMTEGRVGDELVWEEVSTNLKRGSAPAAAGGPADAGRPAAAAGESRVPSAADLPTSATWQLPGDLGRRYGAVSGDLNPIHIHPLTARLFGFSSAIVHGMWTKARCLAALEPQLPGAFTVQASFRRPIFLPASVDFAQAPDGTSGLHFGVRDGATGARHLDGRVTF